MSIRRAASKAAIIAQALALSAALVLPTATHAADTLVLQRIAPGVYVQLGDPAVPSPLNRGRVGNRGVLVGPSGLVLINTGASREDGEALIEAASRLATLPIVVAIDTQATPDQVLGNAALASRGIPVIAHRATDQFMVQNCATCIRAAIDQVGAGRLGSTNVSRPSWLIDQTTELTLGGRKLALLDLGWTVQPGAIAVLDQESGVLFTGNQADFDVLPEVRTAHIDTWQAALRTLRQRDLRLVVPGHGPVGKPERLDEVASYLHQLEADTRAAYAAGIDLQQASATVGAEPFRAWAGYARLQAVNVHFVYLGLERADLEALHATEAPKH